MKYEQHPLSAAFPLMGEGDLMLMTQDIREHGLREPGVLFEGMILDGWHRYLACGKAKVDFVATEYRGDDPAGYVISRNRHRRHLTLSQIAVAVAQCHKWAPVGKPSKQEVTSTLAQMATEAGVSTKTMQQAKAAVVAGLGDAVRDGQMTVEEAVHVAKGTAPKPPKVEPERKYPLVEMDGPDMDEEAEQAELAEAQFKVDWALFYADDANKHAADQIRQLTAEIVGLRLRLNGLMNELAEARKLVKFHKARADKAEKATKEKF